MSLNRKGFIATVRYLAEFSEKLEAQPITELKGAVLQTRPDTEPDHRETVVRKPLTKLLP